MGRETALYLRISQDRPGLELGVDRQRLFCHQAAERRGAAIDREYVDNDQSATKRKARAEFERLLVDLDAGEVGTVVAYNLDRLLRTDRDKYRFYEACQAHKVNIVLNEGMDIDMTTALGRMMADHLATQARYEAELKAERQRLEREQEAQQGRTPPARRAFGYQPRVRIDGKPHAVSLVEPVEAMAVAEMYRQVLERRPVAAIVRWLNENGSRSTNGNPWTRLSLAAVLTNPRYKGVRGVRRLRPGREGMDGKREKFHDEVAPGDWDAIVSEEVWDAAQAILRDPNRRTNHLVTGHGARYLLPFIALCGQCGQALVTGSRVYTRATGQRVHHRLLRCPALKHVSRKAEPIEEYVEAIVLARLEDPGFRDVLTKAGSPDVDVVDLRGKIQAARVKRDEATAMWADGVLDAASMRLAHQRIDAQLAELNRLMAAATMTDPRLQLVTADEPHAVWGRMPIEQKRAVVAGMVDVVVLEGRSGRPTGRRFDRDTVRVTFRAMS